MINYAGDFAPGSTIYIPWATFASTGASASMSTLATTDIMVYKAGSVTQRASASGFTLLDTDGMDFDGITGIGGISIDLADNTTAGFYEAGKDYWVVIQTVTVDGVSVSFVAATFSIWNRCQDGGFGTTIATLASQTSFTLTAGPADDNALNGWAIIVHDVASAVQKCLGIVSDYTGASKTVTLLADPGVFTMAASDNCKLIPAFMTTGVDVTKWAGTTVATPDTAGYPKVTIKDGTGAGELNLTSGVVDANIEKINTVTIVGDGVAPKFGV